MLVCVDGIVSRRDFGTIFAVTEIGNRRQFRVRAKASALLGTPAKGETWFVHGNLVDTSYGLQMDAAVAYRTLANGAGIQRFLAEHAPGVGEERAARLWDAFGESLPRVLEDINNIDAVAKVIAPERPRLAVRLAAAAIAAWKEASNDAKLAEWFMQRGIADIVLTQRVARILGDKAIKQLAANPYILTPLLPWSQVDALGQQLLIQEGTLNARADPRRLVGAADAAVKAALRTGMTAFDTDWLRAQMARLLGVGVNSPRVLTALDVARRHGALYQSEQGWWRAPGAALMEQVVASRLMEMTRPGYPSWLVSRTRRSPSQILDAVTDPTRPLDPEQREAVLRILERPLAVLQGGAGVGKTYTMRVACDTFEELGWKTKLCALAGKAALRLSRATGRPAMTLARMLGELTERENLEQERRLHGDAPYLARRLEQLVKIDDRTIVVVDEASMVDLATAYSLLKRIPTGARLLLIGDEAQLPPVGFGLVYHCLVKDPAIAIRLTKVHRQKDDSGIPAVSQAIRARQVPVFDRYEGKVEGVSFVATPYEFIAETVERIALELGGHQEGVVVVSPTNRGPAGVREINDRLHCRFRASHSGTEIKGYGGNYYCTGEPVMFLRNDYSRLLFNGLLGQVTDVDNELRTLHVRFDGEYESRVLEPADLIDLTLAYAITCHRAQGSQTARVVIPLYETRIMDPAWIYTAITRAELQVVLVGEVDALERALHRPWAAESRTVGFQWRRLSDDAEANTEKQFSQERRMVKGILV